MTDKILVSRSEIIYMLRNIINIDKPELAAYLVNVNELHALLDKAAISQAEPVCQICFDGNGAWFDVPVSEYDRESINEKRIVYTSPTADKKDAALIDELKLKAKMYHFVRKLNPREFAEIYDINIKTGVHFDHLIVQAMQKGE